MDESVSNLAIEPNEGVELELIGKGMPAGSRLEFSDPKPNIFTFARTAWGYFVLAVLFVTCMVINTLLSSARVRRLVVRWHCRALCLLSGISIERRIPSGPLPQAIYVSNHSSYMDIPVIYSSLPPPVSFVAKRELKSNPFIRFFFSRVETQFIDRFDARQARRDLDEMAARIHAGDSICFFAEGTFLASPGILPFRAGAFVLAERFGLPVVPISLKGTREALRGDQPYIRPHPVVMTVHDPLPLITEVNRQQVRARCRSIIASAVGEPLVG